MTVIMTVLEAPGIMVLELKTETMLQRTRGRPSNALSVVVEEAEDRYNVRRPSA